MHELSIATAMLDQLEDELAKRPGVRIAKVGVKIGELSGVDPDALRFGFEALVKDSHWDPLALEIEYIRRQQKCPRCQHEWTVEHWSTECPNCSEMETLTLAGDELHIAFLEVDET